MTPYYIFLIVVMFFASLSSKNPKNKAFLFITIAVMVLFAGLRSTEVGTDSISYAESFEEGRSPIEGGLLEKLTHEVGFYYLNVILSAFSKQYAVLFLGIALLTYSSVVTAIRRETNQIVIPLFVFITLGLYTFVFNAARQGIAVGVYMLSFKYLFEKGKKSFFKYVLVVIVAALFQKTAIIALPLYFLFRQKFSIKMLALIVVLGAAIGSVLPIILLFAGSMDTKYLLYSSESGGGEMLTVFYVLIFFFFLFWRKKVDLQYQTKYDVFLNMMLLGTMIFVVVQIYGVYVELTRFAAYFQVSSVFLWAYIYQSSTKPKQGVSFAIIVGHLIYFFIFCSRMAHLVPYVLNPQL